MTPNINTPSWTVNAILELQEALKHWTNRGILFEKVERSFVFCFICQALHEKLIWCCRQEKIPRCGCEKVSPFLVPPFSVNNIPILVLEFQERVNRHELIQDDFLALLPLDLVSCALIVLTKDPCLMKRDLGIHPILIHCLSKQMKGILLKVFICEMTHVLEELSFQEEFARIEFLVFPILPSCTRINQRALVVLDKELLPQLEDVIC